MKALSVLHVKVICSPMHIDTTPEGDSITSGSIKISLDSIVIENSVNHKLI